MKTAFLLALCVACYGQTVRITDGSIPTNDGTVYVKQPIPTSTAVPVNNMITLPVAGQPSADVTVMITPLPLKISRGVDITTMGMWSARMCSQSAGVVVLQPEQIFMAFPDVWSVDPAIAQMVIEQSHRGNKYARAARIVELGMGIATVVTGGGMVKASAKLVSSLALGTLAANQIDTALNKALPPITAITSNLLNGPVTLQPASPCTSKIFFAGIHKGAHSETAVVSGSSFVLSH